jgi:hypothetical protein
MGLLRLLADKTGLTAAIQREERERIAKLISNGVHIFDQPHKRRYAFHGAMDALNHVTRKISANTLTADLSSTYNDLVEREQGRWKVWSQQQQQAKREKKERKE